MSVQNQKKFCFTVDDNIRFLKELTQSGAKSLFDHPYMKMYRRLHERFGLKVQLNLFYEVENFDLSQMSDRFREEWKENADWLKTSFHSKLENARPYFASGYDEVFRDCGVVHREILRFASSDSLAKTTTVHYCVATQEGLSALRDQGVEGLLGLYGTSDAPRNSHQTSSENGVRIRLGETITEEGISYAGIDLILNDVPKEEIVERIRPLLDRGLIKVMIHEQYFYSDYHRYQPDFEEKLETAFEYLVKHGYQSVFFEDVLSIKK